MRELYAVELRPVEAVAEVHEVAVRVIAEWATRKLDDVLAADIVVPSEHLMAGGRLQTLSGSDGGWVLRWWQDNVVDPSLQWFTECAVSGPAGPARVTVRIRIGQHESAPPTIGPLTFEFGPPGLVRTLLGRLTVEDAGEAVEAKPALVTASTIHDFVQFLEHGQRVLPVVLLSGEQSTGRPIVDADGLARDLAGLAHVRVLSAAWASRKLTEVLGPERSVWWGAVRIYWPGFTRVDNPYQHKRWLADRLREPGRTQLGQELLRWLGALSSARTLPHPSIKAATSVLGERGGELPDWVVEYVAAVEKEGEEQNQELTATRTALVEAENNISVLEEENDRLKRSFQDYQMALRAEAVDAEAAEPRVPVSVGEAVDWAIDETDATSCVFLESARKSGLEFSSYRDPAKLYRAIMDVAEASSRYRDGSLGMSVGQWFAQRGYGYQPRDDGARHPRTKESYVVQYKGQSVFMEPHLKVDEATHPDQCLRIYWHVDKDERVFVVGHIGSHL